MDAWYDDEIDWNLKEYQEKTKFNLGDLVFSTDDLFGKRPMIVDSFSEENSIIKVGCTWLDDFGRPKIKFWPANALINEPLFKHIRISCPHCKKMIPIPTTPKANEIDLEV